MRRKVFLGALTLGAVILTTAAGSVSAAQAAPGSAGTTSPAAGKDYSFSASSQQAAVAFWTPARRAAAHFVEDPVLPSSKTKVPANAKAATPSVTGKPLRIPGVPAPTSAVPRTDQRAAADPTVEQPWPSGGAVSATTGKIFAAAADGNLIQCSGEVVASANASTVLTAAHCLVAPDTGEVFQNVVFVPGVNPNASAPFGIWSVTHELIPSVYSTGAPNFVNGDYAFVVVSPNAGKVLQRVVGGQGIEFNVSHVGEHVWQLGYGLENGLGGNTLGYCSGIQTINPLFPLLGINLRSIPCVTSTGARGGVVMANDMFLGFGTVIGSSVSANTTDSLQSFLDENAKTLYNQAATTTDSTDAAISTFPEARWTAGHSGLGVTDGTWIYTDISTPSVEQHSSGFNSDASGVRLVVTDGHGENGLEVGWMANPGSYGDTKPHLYIREMLSGIPAACWTGGPNQFERQCDYQKRGTTSIVPGSALPSGTKQEFGLQHVTTPTPGWNIGYAQAVVAFVPDSDFFGSWTPDAYQFGGWVSAPASDTTPCTDMGNKLFSSNASADSLQWGFFRSGNQSVPSTDSSGQNDVPSWYSVHTVSDHEFRFGGPGAC